MESLKGLSHRDWDTRDPTVLACCYGRLFNIEWLSCWKKILPFRKKIKGNYAWLNVLGLAINTEEKKQWKGRMECPFWVKKILGNVYMDINWTPGDRILQNRYLWSPLSNEVGYSCLYLLFSIANCFQSHLSTPFDGSPPTLATLEMSWQVENVQIFVSGVEKLKRLVTHKRQSAK